MILALTGSNDFLIKQTIDQMVGEFVNKFGVHGVEKVSGDELAPERLLELLQGASLFAAERLVVIKEASKNKPVWDTLGKWADKVPTEVTLVLVEPSIDKRTALYKQLASKKAIQTLEPLVVPELVRWLQKVAKEEGSTLGDREARYLIERVGTDQWQLWQELNKLLNLESITIETIDELVEANPQANAFALLDALFAGNPQKTKHLLHTLRQSEDPYRFFALLASQLHVLALLVADSNRSSGEAAKAAGVHPFVAQKLHPIAKKLTYTSLTKIVRMLADCDEQLKTSSADPWLNIEQLCMKIATR